eukprot:EG_transcript_16973
MSPDAVRQRWVSGTVAAAAVAAALLCVVAGARWALLDLCLHNRFTQPPAFFPGADILLHITELLVLACLGASFWDPLLDAIKGRRTQLVLAMHSDEMVLISSTILWYYASFAVVKVLKHVLDDRSCSKHANSVSGHANLFAFLFLSLPALRYMRPPPLPSGRQELRWLLCYLLLVALGVWQLWRTYFWGYHSLRQLVYGAGLGLISHALWAVTLVHRRRALPSITLAAALVSGAGSLIIVPAERQTRALVVVLPVFFLTWRHWTVTQRAALCP